MAVKGKTEPLALFRPLAPRARFGTDVTRTHSTPLVGRELEKPLLIGTFERSAQQRSCQLVTIVGEPGVGKSRLCAELFAHIEDRPGLVRWRQGRCLPYGEGIAFWALGEIVKAECGILSRTRRRGGASSSGASPDDPDCAWLEARLARSSARAGARLAGGVVHRLAARPREWPRRGRRCSSSRTCTGQTRPCSPSSSTSPTGRRGAAALLCTARPELYEQHPSFGANARTRSASTSPR